MRDAFANNKEAADHDIAKRREAEKKEAAQKWIDEASNTGRTELLYVALNLHSQILVEINGKEFVNTPLHEAAKMGHSRFCAEMMNLKPSFGRKLNPDGFSPLHVALQHKQYDVVQALFDIDKELIRVKGRDGITPLIYCAQKREDHNDDIREDPKINDTLALFLRDCPQAIYDKTTSSQTALHVALNTGNCKAAEMILNWIRRSSREEILHWKDDEGNTPLHLAVKYPCTQAIEMLVQHSRLNKKNKKSETPLDIALKEENGEAVKLLKRKKAKISNKLASRLYYSEFLQTPMSRWERAIQTYTILVKDLDTNMRNVVLVVAVLIATATYTAMLQPPGGIYQASATATTSLASSVHQATTNTTTINRASSVEQHSNAGKMVMNHYNFKRFMPTNTLAFTMAIVVIIFVLPGRPYTVFLHLSLLSLSYSCLIAMTIVSEEGTTSNVSFFLAWSLLAFTVVVKLSYFLLKGLMWEVWWMPNFFVLARNYVESCGCPSSRSAQESMSLISTLRKQYRLTVGSLNQKP